MQTPTQTQDWPLLRQYIEQNSQSAFALLVKRHLNLVYATCRREVGDDTLAEDVTQAVFLLLARKAPSLRAGTHLAGWLFQTARFAARNAQTREQRRRQYEQKAGQRMASCQTAQDDAVWSSLEPFLNDAIARLSPGDREALLLRFWDDQSLAETGAALGVSEDAARKRVTRAVERLRHLLGKQGILVPGATLAALLPAHAAGTAPATLAPAIAQITAGITAGHVINAGLAGSHAYQLSEGVLRTMKIAQLKVIAGLATMALIGSAAYAIVRGDTSPPAQGGWKGLNLNDPIPTPKETLSPGGKKDIYRNVLLVGKVRYEDGKPAGGVLIGAQVQNNALDGLINTVPKTVKKFGPHGAVSEESWNNAQSKLDGSYTLPVGAGLPYNVMVLDSTGKWVAAALEGVSGNMGATVTVPDLILTKGALVAGSITDSNGKPVAGVSVGTYGPQSPATSAAVTGTQTDQAGHYRLRVAPGRSRVYISSNGPDDSQNVEVAMGEIKIVNFTTP